MKNLNPSWGAPGISTKSSAVHHSPGSTLTHKCCVGSPWEMLYADDLVILAEKFDGLMTNMAFGKMV